MVQAKTKRTRSSVALEISGDQPVLDGYQSDGEDSDLSARADEIASQVLADDQSKTLYILSMHMCYLYLPTLQHVRCS